MKYKIAFLLILAMFYSCSNETVKETSSNGKAEFNSNSSSSLKKFAMGKFIDGSVLESKGLYSEAIEQYLAAVSFDPQPGIFYALAKNYFRLNKLSSATNYSQKAVQKEPGNTEYLTLLATIYSSSHQDDSAAVIYKKIINLDSMNVSAYFNLGQLHETKKPSEAISLYKKILKIIGPEWNVLIRLADLNERMGNIDETIKTVEELIQMNPSELQLQKLLIDSYLKTKKYDRALVKLDESLISYPDDESLIELKGKAFILQEKWNDASTEYLKLIKSKKINIESKIRIGSSFFAAAEKDSNNILIAEKIFKEINRDTSDWQVNASLGEIEIKKHNDSSAVKYFKTAAKLAEWNVQVWIRLGGLLFDSRRYKEAIEYLSQAYNKFPNDFAINMIYGLSLSADNNHIKAKEALKRALNINPDDVNALGAYGYSLNQLKADDEAMMPLRKALSIEPNNLQVLSLLAMIHESKKEYSISDSLYNKAIQIDSTNILILNNYAYSLAERGIKLNDALRMSQKSIDREPKNASYLDTYGWIHFKLGDYKKAKVNIEEAAKMEDTNATLLDHLGDVYFKLGNKSKAKEYWEKALKNDTTKTEIKMKIDKGEL